MTNPLTIAALAALSVATAVYLLTSGLPLTWSAAARKLKQATAQPDLVAERVTRYQFGTQEFRAALTLRRLHIPFKPGEELQTLQIVRLVLAAIGGGAGLLFGLPLVLVIAIPAVLWFAVDLVADMQVASARRSIESSVASVFSDVAGMVTLTTNAETILQRATHNLLLAGDTALAPELEQVASHLHSNGRIALVEAEARVQKISPSLSLLFFIVRRLQDTGGAQFGATFQLSADNLGQIMSVRQKIQAKADGARGTIRTIAGVFAFILAQMLLNGQMREAYTTPAAQLILAGAIGMMVFGYWFISSQVEEIM